MANMADLGVGIVAEVGIDIGAILLLHHAMVVVVLRLMLLTLCGICLIYANGGYQNQDQNPSFHNK